jgi:hypothetical protein
VRILAYENQECGDPKQLLQHSIPLKAHPRGSPFDMVPKGCCFVDTGLKKNVSDLLTDFYNFNRRIQILR